MAKVSQVDRVISSLSDDIRMDFKKNRRILSFAEYLRLVFEEPRRHIRSSAQFIRDCFDHFGTDTVDTPLGETRRFRLFDGLPGGSHYLIGQEHAQNAVYRVLNNFIREGRANRLVLLHGPNGSAKSSLIACIAAAMEAYSRSDEGALYRFNWVFPADQLQSGAIGFGGKGAEVSSLPSYAHLEELAVNSKIIDELRDNPLLLIPKQERKALYEKAGLNTTRGASGDGCTVSDHLLDGDLSAKNKAITEALLAAYHGDFTEVLKHVQVERFFISRRYREGLATVGPEMRVDAGLRQITTDRSLGALPGSLQNLALYEPFGDLVDANRGMVEFNDLLKRPMDLNRYLLSTSESGTVPLDNCTLYLDSFLIGTVNEAYLDALKGQPDWASYKGRIELVRMGYLRDFKTEAKIYEVQLGQLDVRKPVAPHVCELAALWAVLTRLKRPEPDRYPEALQETLKQLTPSEKADMYATGALPDGLSSDAEREMRSIIGDLYLETAAASDYEGRFGASPREIKNILLNAAHSDEHPCFSPLALLGELEQLVSDPTVYEFLQLKPDGLYHLPADFVDLVRKTYLDQLDDEVRSAMGLIEDAQYQQLFARYVDHVNFWVRKEKMLSAVSGKYEPPDEQFMLDVEKKLGIEEHNEDYRNGIISSIGAFRIEQPEAEVDYGRIFARQFETLRASFFEESREAITKIKMNLLRFFDGDIADLAPSDQLQIENTMANLSENFGYTPETAKEAVGFLVRQRYQDAE